MMPELAWKSPIFHPNISASGVVCLGGYGTYWVPSLALADLCGMLWDMLRFENFDETSPYNREAAAWAKSQVFYRLPIDPRPLRDKVANAEPLDDSSQQPTPLDMPSKLASPRLVATSQQPSARLDVTFLGDVVEAEVVASGVGSVDGSILFIE